MPTFTDNQNRIWTVEITADGAARVRDLVKDTEGAPVDLFAAAESGKFDALKNIQVLTKVVFVLCLSQVLEEFNVEKHDTENAEIYELIPDRRDERKAQKAARWFSNGITGPVMETMTDALMQAIINFTTNQTRRDAIREVLAREKELEDLAYSEVKEQLTGRLDSLKATVRAEIGKYLDGLTEKPNSQSQSAPRETSSTSIAPRLEFSLATSSSGN